MLTLVIFASAAVQPAAPPIGSARSVIEAQLQAAPRVDDQLPPEEADAIRQRYLESIGKPVEGSGSGGGMEHWLKRKYDSVSPRP
ncbi:hypothetical protein ACFSTI_19800 [Rhizorhabdus histidinilytica]|jgi:hypothetical protein|uniref:hypothetical protein n=1 Tax=Rhizorhabdus histidinilytica TaxID=439228 RepID=UPI001591F249|nr:hypothetical protein [Rhizorhabdus histidinilytica]